MAKRKSTLEKLKQKVKSEESESFIPEKENIKSEKSKRVFKFGIKVESDNVLTYHHVFCPIKQKVIAVFYAGKFYTEDAKLAVRLEELGYKQNEVRDLDAEDIQPLGLVAPKIKTQADVDKENAS